MELLNVPIQIDPADRRPRYRQIAEAVQAQLRDGQARAGLKLPPARLLAARLKVNPGTVVQAYRFLTAEGWVESRVGSGTFVCERLEDPAPAKPALEERLPELFPTATLKRVISHILNTDCARAFSYDDIAGYPPLLESLRSYLRSAGIEAGEDELVIFSGAQQGLSVIVQALLQRGDWVLVERPTYPGILRLLQRVGAQVEAVDLGADGPDLRACERILRTRPVRLFYTMPVYQNPTGICYSADKKRALLDLCATHGVTLVEDDSLSDLDYGSGRPLPLRAVAGAGHDLLYLKSLSRLLMPGFRLGFCLTPPATAARLRRAKEEADLFTSGFFQRVLHLFLRHGYLAEHVRRLETSERRHFRAALNTAHRVLDPAAFRLLEPAGGPRLWVQLPPGVDPARFAMLCIERHLPATPGAEFAPDGSTAGWLSLLFGHVRIPDWERQLRGLRDAARELAERRKVTA